MKHSMNKVLLKDTFRELWKTKSRFIAIFAIVALGTGFFAGVKVTCPDMKLTADQYFENYNLMDFKVVSTYGLNQEDIEAISSVPGIDDVMPAYSMDVIINTESEERVARVHSIPNEGDIYINRTRVIEGRLPEKSGECVIEKSKYANVELEIGDNIKLNTGKEDKAISDFFNKDIFKIVGYVETPYYLTFEKGTSTLGNGSVSMFTMIPEEDFKMDVFTEVFLTLENKEHLSAFSDEYKNVVSDKTKELEAIADDREEARFNEIYNEAKAKIDDAKKELSDGEKKQQEELSKALEKLKTAEKEISSGKQKLADRKKIFIKEIVLAEEELVNSEKELGKGQQEYASKKVESDKKLDDARKEISEAEKKINEIEKPKWYILDRKSNAGYSSYQEDTEKVDAIAKIFPVFFFIVAAFVCLTTMTRMVEEHRTQIGTYKALGYSNFNIALKYLIYTASASVFGSIFGLIVGMKLFPFVIANAYGMLYMMPPTLTPFRIDYAFWITLGALVATSLAVYFACYNELREQPAQLMRPRSPKMGKRVFLERIPFIWNRLNFFSKVTIRNLFRYKKRLVMTLLGVAGCTSLILAGFGLRDGISSIVPKQYGEVFYFDSMVIIDENSNSNDKLNLMDDLNSDPNITDTINVRLKNLKAGGGEMWQKIYLMVPEDTTKLQNFISIHRMENKEPIKLSDDGVVIGEKLAELLDLHPGSEIKIKDDEFKEITVKVAAINENYALHYIYMTPALYEKVFGEKPVFNSILVNMENTTQLTEDSLSNAFIDNKAVLQVSFTSGTKKGFSDMVGNLNSVVFIMIISAGALAFVVLYNLTNININERIREIASIKVLGFYDIEVSQYVFRENIILTLINTCFGLLGGIVLNKFVLTTSETDVVMFGREIYWYSYIYAAALTLVFAVLVNIVMHYKLKKISMIESLKSVE